MNFGLLGSAFLLGVYAGIAPGPTQTLVMAQTLKFGKREGFKVAIAPLLTDPPIILLSVALLGAAEGRDRVLALVSGIGAAVLIAFALDCFRAQIPTSVEDEGIARHSILKGMLVNVLNPHPYLTWITVAGPLLIQAWQEGSANAGLFFVCMYLPMIGLKAAAALVVDSGRQHLQERGYRWVLRGLGGVLLIFAARIAWRAIQLW